MFLHTHINKSNSTNNFFNDINKKNSFEYINIRKSNYIKI